MEKIEKFNVKILNLIEQLEAVNGVNNINVKLLSKNDMDIYIKIQSEKFRIPILIQLESRIYMNTAVGIKAIKSIKNGLSVLDTSNYTYKIEIQI